MILDRVSNWKKYLTRKGRSGSNPDGIYDRYNLTERDSGPSSDGSLNYTNARERYPGTECFNRL